MKKQKIATRKRLLNIARRMILEGETFYITKTPRISLEEYKSLIKIGFHIQSEHSHQEIRMFYAMREFYFHNVRLYEILLCRDINGWPLDVETTCK